MDIFYLYLAYITGTPLSTVLLLWHDNNNYEFIYAHKLTLGEWKRHFWHCMRVYTYDSTT